jgi:hypothetical protein
MLKEVISMYKNGEDFMTISESTGLTKNNIKNIIKGLAFNQLCYTKMRQRIIWF